MVSVSRCLPYGKGFALRPAGTAVDAQTKKSGPITGATVQKRQRVGKSGRAMRATDPPVGPAESEKSRTESEGQARPLFLLPRGALAQPKGLFLEPEIQCCCKLLRKCRLDDLSIFSRATCDRVARGKPMHIPAHWLQDTTSLEENSRFAAMSCPQPFAAYLAGSGTAARAR
jgi:hypothetical protein